MLSKKEKEKLKKEKEKVPVISLITAPVLTLLSGEEKSASSSQEGREGA